MYTDSVHNITHGDNKTNILNATLPENFPAHVAEQQKKNLSFTAVVDFQPRNLLLVEDDEDMARLLKNSLIAMYPRTNIQLAHDPYEALDYMLDKHYEVLISDWNLPSMKAKKIFQVAEQNFGIDPTINEIWDRKKTNVITFSTQDSIECRLSTTRHFNYLGHVGKRQNFETILGQLKNHINKCAPKPTEPAKAG